MVRRALFFALCCSFLAGSVVVATARRPSSRSALLPSRAWKLAFVRKGDIWLANGDGSGQHRVIKNGEAPAWSPDRKQVAFARAGNVWVAKADGTSLRQLTTLPEANSSKSDTYAPAGRALDISWDRVRSFVTFSRQEMFWIARGPEEAGEWRWGAAVYHVPLHPVPPHIVLEALWTYTDDAAEYTLTYQAHPAWAPDGKRMVFARDGDIWLGARTPEEHAEPEWSRRWGWDVTRLAAVARYDAPTYRASRENDGATHLSWAPDGKVIAYSWERLGGSGTEMICLLDPASGKHWRIADEGIDPCFSPDGQWVAYEGVGEKQGVFAISRDGKRKAQLVKDGEQPAW